MPDPLNSKLASPTVPSNEFGHGQSLSLSLIDVSRWRTCHTWTVNPMVNREGHAMVGLPDPSLVTEPFSKQVLVS